MGPDVGIRFALPALRFSRPFDGCHTVPAAVSKICRFRLARNHYCINARAVGKPVGAICVEALGR
ncbi:putative transposase [Rhodovulum sulfidophilum]|uniref:Putative transposase n=1 Tax=Rhodovulum sulfidophilum TaxID=35806 RepID=A0A0D6B7R5_RHOSU|nr:putative transposase [Rhodovulum sulfidophilum]